MNVENGSLWINTVGLPCYPAWNGDREVDVAVIGGGLAGILTAHFLEQAGRKCVVLEADRIGSGQTKNTTAKVTSQHGLIYGKLMRTVGRDMAQQYADANREAIERYRILIRKYGIECEWETCGAYLYGTEKERELREEYRAAVELGISARMIDHPEKTELPFPAKKALLFERQARFHPLKFLERILDGLEIYERTRVLRRWEDSDHGPWKYKGEPDRICDPLSIFEYAGILFSSDASGTQLCDRAGTWTADSKCVSWGRSEWTVASAGWKFFVAWRRKSQNRRRKIGRPIRSA